MTGISYDYQANLCKYANLGQLVSEEDEQTERERKEEDHGGRRGKCEQSIEQRKVKELAAKFIVHIVHVSRV